MIGTQTETVVSLEESGVELSFTYCFFVCLGSAGIGAWAGWSRGGIGSVFGAVGGVGVAILWLNRVSKFRIRPSGVSVSGGVLWGIIAGVIDTFWLHMSAQVLGYHRLSTEVHLIPNQWNYVETGLIVGVIAGLFYGGICIVCLNNLLLGMKGEER